MDLSDSWINLNGLMDLVIQRVNGLGGGLFFYIIFIFTIIWGRLKHQLGK